MRKVLVALMAVSLVSWLSGSAASALTVSVVSGGINGSSGLTTFATDNSGGSVIEVLVPASIPFSATSSSVDGGASATSIYDLSNSGFDITFDHSRPGTLNSFGKSEGNIFFSVDVDTDYLATGSYTAVDSEGRRLFLFASLTNTTLESEAFYSLQDSRTTQNESFELGLTGGDNGHDVSTGSLSGTLVAGHVYWLKYSAFLQASPSASISGASASGFLSLTFVPEPGTATLLGLGLAGLCAFSRRRGHS